MLRPIPRTIASDQTPGESSFRTSIATALERANQASSSTIQPHIWAQVSDSNSDPEEHEYALTSCSDVFVNDDLNLDLPEEDEEAKNADDAPVYGPYIPLEAEEAIAGFAEGKDIEQIANEYGMNEQDVLQLIEESEYTIDLNDESDLAIEKSNSSSEIEVVEIIDGDGNVAIVVYDEEGNATTLDPEQKASREGVDDILEGVYEGESINEIAESQGLTREQIIAQLNAAGYELEILTDEAGNAIGIKIQDVQSGEEVASSSYNLQGGTRTSSFTDSEGNEFSQNESDSIEHVVQAGEYLTLIAEYYGVTLEDLKRDNPEYFASPRDPNLIYSGETLTINGSSTTIETTASGYTLTTHMDGSRTLQNADGTQVEMEQGSFLDVIAEEFLTTNIDNDDSETIKNDEVLQVIIDASLERSEITSLEEELEDIQTKIQENTSLLNQGLVDVEDYLYELKIEEKEVLGEREGLWLSAEQTQAQWNVFALDPNYEDAISDVEDVLDKAGCNWEPEEPEGTLEDARVRLDETNAWVDLVTANREWEQQEEVFDDFQQLALDTAREDERYEKYFDPNGYLYEVVQEGYTHSIGSFSETGGLVDQYVSYDESNHQLYLVNVYEDKEVKIQLTFSPDEEVEERSEAMQQLDQEWEGLKYGNELAAFEGHPPEGQEANQAWQEFISNNDRGDGIIATNDSLFGASSNLLEAKQAFNETTVYIKADEINEISENISALTQARDDAMEQYGEGTLVPYGNGEPQQIDIDERHQDEWGHLDGRWVAPEVADAYDAWVAASNRYSEGEDLKQRVRDDFEEEFENIFQHSHVFSSTGEGEEPDPTTSYVTDEVIEKDGQLYLQITYEGGIEETQLTFASEEELPEWRDGKRWSTDQEWAEWKENAQGSDITSYLDNPQDSYNQAKEAFEAALTTYGEGSEKKVTDSLPEDIEPVLMHIGDDQRWVHPEVAEAQLALDDGRLALDTANLEKEQAQEAAATTTHLLSSPSTWQLLDNDAGPTLDPEDSWWKSDDYLEQHNRVLQAQQSLADTQLTINVNQQGVINANINLIEKEFTELSNLDTSKAEKDEWEEQERNLIDEIPESQVWLAAHEELTALQENREDLEEYQVQVQQELNSNSFMLEQSEEDRLDDKQQGKIDQQYHDQHPEAAAYIVTDKREQLAELTGSEELHVSAGSEDFKDYVKHALGTDENEIVDSVIDEIVEIGGDQAEVEIVPILYLDPSDGERTTALFRVMNEKGTPYLVDESGKRYKNIDDYQNNNYLLEDGKIFVPRNLNNITDIDGVIDYEWRQARVRSNVEKVVDPIVGIGTTAATVAVFIPPLAPVAAPLAFAGGAYLGGRALHKQFNHIEHGGEWNDTESWMNYLSVASTAMPMGSSLLRTGGMLRTIDDISGWQAFQASIGGARLKSSNLFLARRTSTPSPYSGRIEAYMQSRDWRNVIAYGADWGAIGTGVPLMGMSLKGLLANGSHMSNLEKWDAWLGFGTGFVGTGLGIHGLSMTRPTRKNSIADQSKVPSVDQSLSERFFVEHEIYGKLLQLSPIFRSVLQDSVKNHGVKIIVGERGAGSYYSPADNHIVIDLSLFSEHKAYRLALTLAEELSHSISNNKGLVNWALPGEEIKATPGRLLPLLSHEGQGLPSDRGTIRQAVVDSDVNTLLQEEGAAYLTILRVRDEWLQAGVTIKSDYIPSDRVEIHEQYRNGELSWYRATIALGDLIAKDRPSDAAPGETYRSAKTGQRESVWNQAVGSLSEDPLSETLLQPIGEEVFSFSSAKTPQDERLESLHAFLNDSLGQASQNHAYIVAENDFHEIRVPMNIFEIHSLNRLIKLAEASVRSQQHPVSESSPKASNKHLPYERGETWSAAAYDSGGNEPKIQLPDGPDTPSNAPLRRQPGDKNLPLLNYDYDYDERGFWINNPNDPSVDIKVILADSSGEVGIGPINTETIIVTHFDRGEMPSGSGSIMLADLLRVYEIQPGGRLVFEGIINESTLHAYNTGGDPAQTVIGRSGERALQELGLESAAYRFEQSKWGINLVIDIAPQVSPEASQIFTYRLDSRHPDTVFSEGFQPRFGHRSSKYSQLEEAITAPLWAEDSVFVSTSNELKIAKGAGETGEWVYVIVDPKTGIFVDEFLGPHDWQGASEVVYDAIPREYIVGARQLSDDNKERAKIKSDGELSSPTWARTYTGEFVRNPFFDASLWSISRGDANKHIAPNKHNTAHGLGHEPRSLSATYHPTGAPYSKPPSNISSDSIGVYDNNLPGQNGETWSSATYDSGKNEPKIRLPGNYAELPKNLSLAEGDDSVGRFQDSLFDSSVRDPDQFIASIEAAKQNGEAHVFLISPQTRQRIIGHLQGAWRHILFASPDTPVPHEYSQSDYAFLHALVGYVQRHRISMKEPQLDNTGSAMEGRNTVTFRLYHMPMELKTGSFSQAAEIERFLYRLISGAHFVMPQGENGGDFFQSFKQSSADKFAGDAKGHSHYKRKGALFRHSGMAYPNNINEAPSLLTALLIDRTEKNSTSAVTFLQLEGWPASGLLGIGGRHGQDFKTHRKTGWNISTYGASPFSEKQGLAISLEPADASAPIMTPSYQTENNQRPTNPGPDHSSPTPAMFGKSPQPDLSEITSKTTPLYPMPGTREAVAAVDTAALQSDLIAAGVSVEKARAVAEEFETNRPPIIAPLSRVSVPYSAESTHPSNISGKLGLFKVILQRLFRGNSAEIQSIQEANREKLNLPHWVTDAELEVIKSLKALSPDEISVLPDASLRNIETWYLLLLTREQLQAWPSQSASQKSMEEWSANLRLPLLKKTAKALLEPTVIRSRLPNVLDSTTPNHAESTFVFRGATRGPEEIFRLGFMMRPSDTAGGISTSLSARKARWWANTKGNEDGGWVYTIEAEVSDGEIFQSLPARPQHSDLPGRDADINNFEIRLNSINGHNILAARQVDSEGNFIAPPVYNQNFKDPSRLPTDYRGDSESDAGPGSLSAAYHPEGAPYPEQPSRIPEAFRKPQPPSLPDVTSSRPFGLLPEGFTVPLVRPLAGPREAIPPTASEPKKPSATPAPEQETSFSSAQVVDFKPAQLRGLTKTQIPTILPEHLAQIPPGRMTHFTPEQVAVFTKEQLTALTNDQVQKLTPRQLEALAPEQIAGFTPEQLGKLRPKQVKALTSEQIAALTPDQVAALTEIQVTALSKGQCQALTPTQLLSLTNDQVRKLTPMQLEALTPEQVAAFTRERLSSFSPNQLAALDGEQIGALSAWKLRALSEDQLQAIHPDALMHIKPNRLMWLWPEQIAALKSEQVAVLSPKQIASLTSVQIAVLTDSQIMALSTDQWQALALKQLRELSDEQLQLAPQSVLKRAARSGTITVTFNADGPVILLHGANKEDLGMLVRLDQTSQNINEQGVVTINRKTLEGFLNPRANYLLPNDVQLRVRAADNTPVEQGGKFQKTAIASALIAAGAVGAVLSIYPTANALAYAWRGASFVYRGYRQEATAAHTAQGRTLRFVEFFTICINTPNAYIEAFNNPWVDGSYAFGNTVYGYKTFMETVTGKPQLPFADDLGLPAYFTGSTPSIYNSGADVFVEGNYAAFGELAAASFFGFGSAYLWTRDSFSWNQFLKHRFRPFGTSESSMDTGLLPVEVEPAGAKRDIAFAITIGGGLVVSSMDAFGFFGQGTSDSEPDDDLPSPEKSSSEPDETPSSDQPIEPTPEPTQTQFVVTVPDGLNLRSQPSEDAIIVASFSYGAFVYSAGPQETDPNGNIWLPVSGIAFDGNEQEGWVMARYLDEHVDGAMTESGRINPDLENQALDWVGVQRNDTLTGIAVNNSHAVDDVESLNDEHILDLDTLYPGDRIYLPD